MKWNLAAAGLLTVFVVDLREAPPAEACGVKLTVKSSAPRKAVARTSNPSDVLLLGDPPRRLERDLVAAGHRVDSAPNAGAAQRKPYAVVITDSKNQNDARTSFGSSVIVVATGDVATDMRVVEKQVARKPLRTDEGREVVAAKPARKVVAAGPPQEPGRKIVDARATVEVAPAPVEPPAPAPAPPPVRVTTETRPRPEVRPDPPAPRPAAVKANTVHDEVYFGFNSSKLQSAASLARAIRWMTDSKDVTVVVEGHADPTGTPEANLALAQMRAEWVRDALVAGGIDASRIEVISYGDTRLKYGRTDRRNRRAAIVVK